MRTETAVALLRGINVGGKNLLPMKALAEIFADVGCTDIKTYIQSGNVIFRHAQTNEIASGIRAQIAKQFGLKVPVIVRSAAEMVRALQQNPLLKRNFTRSLDEATLHVMFLEDEPSAHLIAALDPERSVPDEFVISGREVYLHLPNGAGNTRLTNAYFDAKLKTVGTQRNWRTVKTLVEIMSTLSDI